MNLNVIMIIYLLWLSVHFFTYKNDPRHKASKKPETRCSVILMVNWLLTITLYILPECWKCFCCLLYMEHLVRCVKMSPMATQIIKNKRYSCLLEGIGEDIARQIILKYCLFIPTLEGEKGNILLSSIGNVYRG